MKKKIAVILTGGTIGSSASEGIINTAAKGRAGIESLTAEYEKSFEFEFIRAAEVLSENLDFGGLNDIFSSVFAARSGRYDGIIITHGTDTLAFSSPMTAFLLSGAKCAAVIVSADKPLENPASNGRDNFRSAIALFESGIKSGVYTAWRSRKGENKLHLASRVTQADCYSDDIHSFGGEIFARVRDGKLIKNPNIRIGEKSGIKFTSCPELKNEVLALSPYPGINYDRINISSPPAAVLHYLYHSATACVKGENTSAAKFIEKCKKIGCPIYLASFKNIGGDIYDTTDKLIKAGGMPLLNISFEAAYAKLLLAYNQSEIPPEEIMAADIAGEIVPFDN